MKQETGNLEQGPEWEGYIVWNVKATPIPSTTEANRVSSHFATSHVEARILRLIF
jgi:hypothetical protein